MTDSEGPDDELAALWREIVNGVTTAQRRIESDLESEGLSTAFVAVLRQLAAADDHRLPMSAIARDLSMTSGGFTKLADRMAREGLIDRRSSDTDRRVVHAQLTPAGLATAHEAGRHYLAALRHRVGDTVSTAELAAVAATATRLRAALSVPVTDDNFTVNSREPAAPDRRGRAR